MKSVFTVFLFIISLSALKAQKDAFSENKGSSLLAKISVGFHTPGGHLQDRFGNGMSLGGGLDIITNKGNWIFGGEFNYFIGTEVKQDVLASLRNEQGQIIGNDRIYADIQLRERGFYTGLLMGKLFIIPSKEKRSGIRVTAGGGILQHKIRIQDDPVRQVPQLLGEYRKGYDRLTNGFALNEYIGYQILSNDGKINFTAGFEFTQGFTQNRRTMNFDTMSADTTKRVDLLYAFRITWVLPFYFGKGTESIFY
jgi:hypothetical protein